MSPTFTFAAASNPSIRRNKSAGARDPKAEMNLQISAGSRTLRSVRYIHTRFLARYPLRR